MNAEPDSPFTSVPCERIRLWLRRWRLTPDGEPFVTGIGSRLLPVRADGRPAMLKLASGPEEQRGAALLAWWAGEGAVAVLARRGPALLMERADGPRSLADMARRGEDETATGILCAAAARLHAPRAAPPPRSLVPLRRWFAALQRAASRGAAFADAWRIARALLAEPRDVRPLHGDIHHGNVLDAGARGWLAIDPKGLVGERGFDLANLACNPDHRLALAPGVLERRARGVAGAAGIEARRWLEWVAAYAALSAAWSLEAGQEAAAAGALSVSARAQALLTR